MSASGLPVTEDLAWIPVVEETSPGAVRRRASEIAERIGLDESRVGEVAIVATELATNLAKYARQGVVLLRVLRSETSAGLAVVAFDHGPGMRDASALFADGESTSGTLGIGLGAVRRLADVCDVHSVPGRGTVVSATFWPGLPPERTVAALARPMEGEDACGDAYAIRETPHGTLVMLSDGLGHGVLAARASHEAVRVFRTSTEVSPAALLAQMHRDLSGTRGAATAVAHVDPVARRVTYAGVGNIAGRVVAAGRKRGLVSMPGIVGHKMRPVQDTVYDLEPDAWVVMHSDGLTDKWDTDSYPGLLTRAPLVVATTLLRDAAVRRDDASVLACRGGTP